MPRCSIFHTRVSIIEKKWKKKNYTTFFSKCWYKRKSASQKVEVEFFFSYEASFIEWIDNEVIFHYDVYT